MALSKTNRKKVSRIITRARIYVQATFNNTLITITDDKGNVLISTSAGAMGFKGTRKSTLYAAQMTMQNALEKVRPYAIKDVDVIVSGVGMGRDSAVRSLTGKNFVIKSIKDVTPIPHNGCRAKKPRRV